MPAMPPEQTKGKHISGGRELIHDWESWGYPVTQNSARFYLRARHWMTRPPTEAGIN